MRMRIWQPCVALKCEIDDGSARGG